MPILLSICIPTFNRSDCLALLLESVVKQIGDDFGDVELVVCDNHSTDDTPQVCAAYAQRCGTMRIIRHPTNLGMDENIHACFDKAAGKYVWIIGDDDLVKDGTLEHVVRILRSSSPDLLYLENRWIPNSLAGHADEKLQGLEVLRLSRSELAIAVNMYITFLSAFVANKERYTAFRGSGNSRSLIGSAFAHLEWILTLLDKGEDFIYLRHEPVLARGGSSGGYKVFKVFGANYPQILAAYLSHRTLIFQVLSRVNIYSFLPGLIWEYRQAKLGKFEGENVSQELRQSSSKYIYYWLVLLPICTLPRYFARFFLIFPRVSRAITRLARGTVISMAHRDRPLEQGVTD